MLCPCKSFEELTTIWKSKFKILKTACWPDRFFYFHWIGPRLIQSAISVDVWMYGCVCPFARNCWFHPNGLSFSHEIYCISIIFVDFVNVSVLPFITRNERALVPELKILAQTLPKIAVKKKSTLWYLQLNVDGSRSRSATTSCCAY